MFTYICLGTNNLPRAIAFYDATLATLGLYRCDTSAESAWEGWAGWGTYKNQGAEELALWVGTPFDGQPARPGNGTMVAFAATSWAQVEDFYATALATGGTSEGEPSLRLHYNSDFYAAYVRDPDGNKLAVVCRRFTQREEQPK